MSNGIVHKADRFNGILVDVSKQTVSLDDFAGKLSDAVQEWMEQGKRGLWVTVSTSHASVIPQLTQMGLDFHHAKPGYVCMTKWLATDVPNNLPGYANHYVGVAGFVVNSKNQVLAIQERYHVKNNLVMWKLPGGLADPGEELCDTAKREVLEETGVRCEFVCLLAFRHMHNYRHGCSDFYHVCLMRPLSLEIKPCPQEIAACKWMDLDEYEASGLSAINKYFVKKYREYLVTGTAIGGERVTSYDCRSLNYVYSTSQVGPIGEQRDTVDQTHHEQTSTVTECGKL